MDMLIDETLAAELVGRDDVTSEVLRRLTYAENDLKMAMDTDEETESRSGHAVSFRVLMNEVRDFCEKLDKNAGSTDVAGRTACCRYVGRFEMSWTQIVLARWSERVASY